MAKKRIAPIYDRNRFSDAIIAEIDYHLKELIYRPLIELLEEETGLEAKWNTKSGLIAALRGGRIQYKDGYFYGQFSASISKAIRSFGGSWDHNKKAFKISLDALPVDLKSAISSSKVKTDKTARLLKEKLDQIEESNDKLETYNIPFGKDVEKIISDLDSQFKKVTPEDLIIEPQIDDALRERIERDYGASLNLEIKGWRQEAISRLRDEMEANVMAGFRSKRMLETIQAEYGVSRNKARFLARNETSILVSKYRQFRYEKIGIEKYQWSTSGDARVREDHKKLDGRIFKWSDPPIVDSATGARANPGEYFQCRCIARPIWDDD